MKYLLSIVVSLIVWAGSIWFVLGDLSLQGITWVIDMPSLMTIVLAQWAVILITGEGKTFIKSLNALFSKKYVISNQDRLKAVELNILLSKVTVYAALFAFTTGLVFMLGMLGDPSVLGPIISVSLISLVYGALINIIFVLPAIYILKHRKNPDDNAAITEKQVVDKLLELCHKQGLSPEEIMEADEINLKK